VPRNSRAAPTYGPAVRAPAEFNIAVPAAPAMNLRLLKSGAKVYSSER